ncbi:MAG: hypothetical protein RL328_720 [Acidobacteriota bacterium]|jgi:hypothetical protein
MLWQDILGVMGWLAAALGGTVAAIAVVLLFTRVLLPNWREQRIRAKAVTWPTIQATLDHACVTEYRPSDTRITFRLDAWFNYTVDGKIHDGMYMREDLPLADAKRLLSKLNKEPLRIAYNPAKPGEYFFEPIPPADLVE